MGGLAPRVPLAGGRRGAARCGSGWHCRAGRPPATATPHSPTHRCTNPTECRCAIASTISAQYRRASFSSNVPCRYSCRSGVTGGQRRGGCGGGAAVPEGRGAPGTARRARVPRPWLQRPAGCNDTSRACLEEEVPAVDEVQHQVELLGGLRGGGMATQERRWGWGFAEQERRWGWGWPAGSAIRSRMPHSRRRSCCTCHQPTASHPQPQPPPYLE